LVVEELYRAVIWVVMGAGCCLMAPWSCSGFEASDISGQLSIKTHVASLPVEMRAKLAGSEEHDGEV
jgi:hypothetical protein